ncbi:RNA-binding protein Nova-1 [Schistosoma japonicum]|nr:RNA-binding protein Nova-1 [Schistosoma japonicum]
MTKEDGATQAILDEVCNDPLQLKGEPPSKISEVLTLKPAKGNVHFKILVPSIAAGAIIGKGGEAITEIQNQTSAKVKMSKANAFYPGTTERVCLIVGTTESILRVFQYISEKVYEKPESIAKTGCEGRIPTERHKQVKILVPNSTAGMIIGKGGSFIKELKDTTGVFIQVSQKSKELNLAERCVTVAGELSQTREAIALILSKIAEDPQSSSCPNISYSEIIGPVASAYPTGSPYALSVGSHPGLPGCGMNFSSDIHFRTAQGSNASFSPPHMNSLSPISPSTPSSISGSIFGGSSSPAVAAAMAAMNAVAACSSNGKSSSALVPNGGRALMGRGVASTHSSNHQAIAHSPHSLLGSVATHYGAKISPTYGPSGPVISSPNSSMGLDGIRSVLKSAGYSDVATDEIANAMDVLSLYGFISMSSLTGCINPSSMINSSSNNHLAVNSNTLSGLGKSYSNFDSGGQQSPVLSNSFHPNDFPLHNFRNFATASAQNCIPSQSSQVYVHRRSSFSSHQPVNMTSHAQANHLTATACNHLNNNIEGIPVIKELNVQESLCVSSDPMVCGPVESHNLDVTAGLYSSITSTERLNPKSSTQSPVLGIRTVSPVSNISISLKRNGVTTDSSTNGLMLRRVSDGSVGEEHNKKNGTCCSVASMKNDTSRTNKLWNL